MGGELFYFDLASLVLVGVVDVGDWASAMCRSGAVCSVCSSSRGGMGAAGGGVGAGHSVECWRREGGGTSDVMARSRTLRWEKPTTTPTPTNTTIHPPTHPP